MVRNKKHGYNLCKITLRIIGEGVGSAAGGGGGGSVTGVSLVA